MASITLLNSTGSDRADQILRGVVGIFEAAFPDRIRGSYVTGSYSNGSAGPTSDLDLGILFKAAYLSPEETEKAIGLCQCCEAINPVLDMWVLSEERIQQADMLGTALQLKLASLPIYGEDVRERLSAAPDERYARYAMHTPFHGIAFARSDREVSVVPLDYPDPNGMFYGYDQWKVTAADGSQHVGTKLLVIIVGWIATALVARRTGRYVGSKQESVAVYRAHINDEWTDLVEQVHDRCKRQWGYRVPEREDDRRQLRALCERALAFENHFLCLYREFLLQELRTKQGENQARAVERLGQIIYRDQEVVEALTAIAQCDDAEFRRAAETVRAKIEAAIRPGDRHDRRHGC